MAAADPELLRLVDKAGELAREVEELEDKKEALGLLKEGILVRLKLKPEQDFLAEGKRFAAVIPAQGFEREVTDVERVLELLDVKITGKGRELFLQMASIGLGKLDTVLTKDQVASVTKKNQTGPRRWKLIQRKP